MLFAGITEGDAIIIPTSKKSKKKHVYLFGDHHFAGHKEPHEYMANSDPSPSEGQHDEFLEVLEETEDLRKGKPLIIYFEKFSIMRYSPFKDLLGSLDRSVKPENFPNITVKDVEVRKISHGVYSFLEAGGSFSKDTVFFEGVKPIGEMTFKDVLDEFEALIEEITPFREEYDEEITSWFNKEYEGEGFIVYFDHLFNILKERLGELRAYLTEQSIPPNTNVYSFVRENRKKEAVINELTRSIGHIGEHLLNLSFLKNILESDHTYIVVIAGCAHTWALSSMLGEMGGKVITRIRPNPTYSHNDYKSVILISKGDIKKVLSEHTFFKGIVRKVTSIKSNFKKRLLKASLVRYSRKALQSENLLSKKIAILTISGLLCILISSKLSKTTNKTKEVLYEILNETNTTNHSPDQQ